jgi:serine/threonine protein kinase
VSIDDDVLVPSRLRLGDRFVGPADGGARLVLVVDDDDDIRELVVAILAPLGFVVWEARDGADALAILAEAREVGRLPDLMLLDLGMPAYPGMSVMLAMKSAGIEVPTIVVTGHEDPTITARAYLFGARRVLLKPIAPRTLREAVTNTVGIVRPPRAVSAPSRPRDLVAMNGEPTLDARTTAGREKHAPKRGHPFGVGECVLDTYDLRRVLGEGGSAVVYEARDRVLGRRVAVKAPLRPDLHEMLLHEARILATLDDPCIPRVLHAGHWRGIPVVVMERVEGVGLDTLIARARERGDRLSVDEAIVLLHRIARTVASVHRAGLAHRDLKPGNIVVGPKQRVYLLDFGIAAPECQAPASDPRGTPAYMAPESRDVVGPGARHLLDLYALGVVAYELLTGRRPRASTDDENAPIPDVRALRPETPPQLARLVHELLARDPAGRPPSAESVAHDLGVMSTRDGDRPPSVLIVDDDVDFAAIARAAIKDATPTAIVTTASDAEQAIEALERAPVDVMFLDLNLPSMNGLELLMYLRDAHLADRTEIAIVTARANDDDLVVSRQLGVVDVVDKETAIDGSLAATHARLVERRRRAGTLAPAAGE